MMNSKLHHDRLSESELGVLMTFRRYLMTPYRMLCFCGPDFERNERALKSLTDRDMLVKESFVGGYSLTFTGFAAMNDCD